MPDEYKRYRRSAVAEKDRRWRRMVSDELDRIATPTPEGEGA